MSAKQQSNDQHTQQEDQRQIFLSDADQRHHQQQQEPDDREQPVEMDAGKQASERQDQQRAQAGGSRRLLAPRLEKIEIQYDGEPDAQPMEDLSHHHAVKGARIVPGCNDAHHPEDRHQGEPVGSRPGGVGQGDGRPNHGEQDHGDGHDLGKRAAAEIGGVVGVWVLSAHGVSIDHANRGQ